MSYADLKYTLGQPVALTVDYDEFFAGEVGTIVKVDTEEEFNDAHGLWPYEVRFVGLAPGDGELGFLVSEADIEPAPAGATEGDIVRRLSDE